MDKTVRITASIDEASFSKATQKISLLVAEVKKLGEAAKGIDLGGVLGGVSGNRRVAGTGQSPGQKTQSQKFTVGGLDNLTRTASSFKTAGDSAKAALKGMSDSFKEHVGTSTREGAKLTRELGEMERALGRLQKTAAGMKGLGLGGGGGEFTQAERESVMPSWKRGLAKAGRFGAPASDFTSQELASIQGAGGRAMSGLRSMGGMSVPGMGGFDRAGSAIAGRLGFGGSALAGSIGGIASGVGAVGAAVNFAMNQRQEMQMSNLDYMANHRPFLAASRASTYGQVFGGNAQAIRGGDLARSNALGELSRGDGFKSIIGNQRQMFQKFLIDKGTPVEFLSNPTLGNAYTQVKNWIGQKTDSGVDRVSQLYSGDVEIPGLSKMQVNEVKNRLQKDFMSSRSAEDFQKIVDMKLQEDPMKVARLNEQYGNAFSEIGLARTAGMGGGIVTRRDGSKFDTIKAMNARFMRSGYSSSEGASMMAQVGATAGRGLMHSSTETLMGAQAGGLGNAVGLYGIGAQFGGGTAAGAGKFFGGVQKMIGSGGGLDITAAGQVLGAGTSAMTAGNFSGFGPGAGLGFLQTLSDAAMYGTPGGDMLGARQVQSGMGAIGQIMSGGLDPLQQGLNYSAALKSAPGGTYTTHKGLLGLDLATATEIATTGNVPEGLRARGVSVDMVRQYIGEQNKTGFARYTSSMGGGTEVGGAVDRYRQSGGLGYLKGKGSKAINSELSSLAEGLMDSTGIDRDTAMGRLRIQASSSGILAKAKGRGARDPVSRSSTAMVAAGVTASYENDDNVWRVANEGGSNAAIRNMKQTSDGQEGVRKHAQKFNDPNDPDAALVGVTMALENFVKSLRTMKTGASGPMRAGPPKL